MEICNNCDELLAHLSADRLHYSTSEYCCGGHLEFQGDVCEVGGYMPDYRGSFFMSPKYPMTLFLIQDNYVAEEGHFYLLVLKGPNFTLDQTLGVMLPNYVKDELIATILGYN